MIGLVLIAIVLVAAIIGAGRRARVGQPLDLGQRLNAPSAAHLFGTDGSGRDILLRVLLGAPLSLAVGVVSVAIGCVLGSLQGLVAGFRAACVGAAIMRFTDAMLAFPALLLALAVMATLGRWPAEHHDRRRPLLDAALHPADAGRGAHDQEARLRPGGARRSARARPRILFQHILPNALSSMLVLARSRSRRRSWPRRP